MGQVLRLMCQVFGNFKNLARFLRVVVVKEEATVHLIGVNGRFWVVELLADEHKSTHAFNWRIKIPLAHILQDFFQFSSHVVKHLDSVLVLSLAHPRSLLPRTRQDSLQIVLLVLDRHDISLIVPLIFQKSLHSEIKALKESSFEWLVLPMIHGRASITTVVIEGCHTVDSRVRAGGLGDNVGLTFLLSLDASFLDHLVSFSEQERGLSSLF